MTIVVETQVPPEFDQVVEWLERVCLKDGLAAAQQAAFQLRARYPQEARLAELAEWVHPQWWAPIEFGSIRLERRSQEHFEFIWSLSLDTEFAKRLKQIPEDLTPRDLLQLLNRDHAGLIPRRRAIQWVIFKDDVPIGVSMFVGINFESRTAEQIMGILPGYDNSFLVGDAYCASLLFAYNTLGMNRVTGMIYAYNEETALLQEKFGFQREGRLRQALWDPQQQRYIDLLQIAMLREDFDRSRVLQRFIGREQRPEFLMTRREWPRQPLFVSPV